MNIWLHKKIRKTLHLFSKSKVDRLVLKVVTMDSFLNNLQIT